MGNESNDGIMEWAGICWNRLELTGNGWNRLEWLYVAANCWKWLEMARKCWELLEWLKMVGNGWNWLARLGSLVYQWRPPGLTSLSMAPARAR